ncbi:GNAT family N-acetyltransferase [Streptomyces caatingaensis]|uniref:Acetyltransferase n=1 Tax=Streptomyces caatingaensis TaxID=1678637 RepID=A0A0K9XCC1_9ACTN|nr:GNAT family N-acetyltransferase [Streptomyces caatingaensis]KNB50751.1 acetyltransferase [Streptomyces caatingaensis]
MTTVEFRTLPKAHLDRALDLADIVFHETPEDEWRAAHREYLLRCDRIGAYDGDELVGMLGAYPLTLSVPGGELPCAGATFAAVAPTHRRRGILSGMLAELWRRCADHDRPLAALWASQAAIYGRFGCGPATHGCTVEIDTGRPLALRIAPADDLPLRLVAPEKAPGVVGPLHAAQRARRAGRVARDDYWWRTRVLPETDEDDDDLGPPRVVTIGAPPVGYAVYRTESGDDEPGAPGGVVHLVELEAETPGAAAALWQYLASIDLTSKVRAWGRPLDDPLLLLAADRDQVRVTQEFPALWLRLVDVAAALEARSWAAPCDLVLDLTDATLPANAGRRRLTAGPAGATLTPTDAAPDLALDVRELAACYLGGTELRHLVRAGLAAEHTPGAAAALDEALRTAYLPHTTDEF